MAEQNAGSIAVELALRSSTFETQMKRAAASVRGIDDEFKVSKAEAEAAGKRFDELGAKGEAASRKLELQEAACQKYSERLEKLRKDLETTAKGQQELAAKLEAAKKAHADSAEALKAHAKAGDLDEASMRALEAETARLKKEEKSLQESYDAGNRALVAAQGKINSTEQAYNKLRIETARTREEADKLTAALESAQKRMEKVSGATGKIGNALTLGLTAPVIAAGTAAATSAVKWEDAFAGVRKTVDATESGYARLQKQIVAMSEEIPVSKEEIAGIAAGAGQLGVAEKDVMKFTRVMADLGVSTDMTGEAAATMFAQYANITGMKLDNVDRLGSMIVDLGNNTATAESKIGEMMQRLAGAGSIVGLTDAQIAGISATLSSLGIEAEAGGTAMSKALSQIDSAVISGGGKLNAYAKIAGVSAKEFSTAWKGDPVAALQLFTNGLGQISAAGGDVNAALKTVGISEVRMTDMMKRLSTSGDMLTKTVRRANAAWEDNTALTDEAAERYGTTASQIQITQNKLSNMATTFGNAFLPTINDGLDAVGNLAQKFANLDDGVRNNIIFGAGAAALTGPVMKAISGVTGGISALLKGIQGVNAVGGLASVFAANPVALAVGIGMVTAGVVAMGAAYQEANSEAAKLAKRLDNLQFGLDDEATAKLQSDVESAKAKVDRTIEIRAEVAEDQENIEAMLDKFLENGKLSYGESNKLAREINSWVNDGIKTAKTNMGTQVDELNATLDRIGATPEQREAAIEKITSKGDSSIAELENYRAEALALVNGLRTGEIEATDDNVARLQELLGIIGDIKAEIIAAGEGVDEFFAQAVRERAARGEGDQTDFVVALNVTHEQLEKQKPKIDEAYAAAISQAQSDLNAANESGDATLIANAQVNLDLLFSQRDDQKAAAEQSAGDAINAVWEGVASNIDESKMNGALEKLDVLSMLQRYYESADPLTYAQQVKPQMEEAMLAFIPEEYDEMKASGAFDKGFTALIPVLKKSLQELLTADLESGDFNPLLDYVGAALQADEIKPEDLAGASNALKTAFSLMDFAESGGELGSNLMDALGLGITENAQTTAEASEKDFQKIIDAAKAAFDIHSPSKVFQDIGKQNMLGLQKGFMESRDLALAPLKLMILNDLPPIGAGMVDALIGGISSRRQALVDEVVGAVRLAISSAQIEANGSPISIPVTLDTSSISMRKLSKELARL